MGDDRSGRSMWPVDQASVGATEPPVVVVKDPLNRWQLIFQTLDQGNREENFAHADRMKP